DRFHLSSSRFVFPRSGSHCALHSFPTRRSSDLLPATLFSTLFSSFQHRFPFLYNSSKTPPVTFRTPSSSLRFSSSFRHACVVVQVASSLLSTPLPQFRECIFILLPSSRFQYDHVPQYQSWPTSDAFNAHFALISRLTS